MKATKSYEKISWEVFFPNGLPEGFVLAKKTMIKHPNKGYIGVLVKQGDLYYLLAPIYNDSPHVVDVPQIWAEKKSEV